MSTDTILQIAYNRVTEKCNATRHCELEVFSGLRSLLDGIGHPDALDALEYVLRWRIDSIQLSKIDIDTTIECLESIYKYKNKISIISTIKVVDSESKKLL